MSLVSLTEGMLFAGRYRIGPLIARGGMGGVYVATHTETQRRCALKVMLPDLVQSQDMRDRFRQEARVAAQVQSEFIVDVFDAGVDEATRMPFLVMELLEGEELYKRLRRVGRFDPQEVVTYLHQTAMALDKTHRANIVHRDLKPANLFLTAREDGTPRIKVLDFGIAKMVAEGATSAAATTSLGTPLYMAPEQFTMGQKISPATDIFALGMMAFTLLVGHAYWKEEAKAGANVFMFASVAAAGPKEAATTRALRSGVKLPASFDRWFARVTAAAPYDRYASATEAVAALAEALGVAIPGQRAPSVLPAPVSGPVSAPQAEVLEAPTQTSAATTFLLSSSVRTQPKPRVDPKIVGAAIGVAVMAAGSLLLLRPWGSAGSEGSSASAAASTSAAAVIAVPLRVGEAPLSPVITAAPTDSVAPALSATSSATSAPPQVTAAPKPSAKSAPPRVTAAPPPAKPPRPTRD